MTRTTASIIVVACSVAALAARQAPPQPPTFRVTVDAVSIDAVVTDRNGEVVRDLTAADFEVFQSGKRQKVTFAHFVRVLAAAAPAAGAVGSSRVPAASAGGAPRHRRRRSRATRCSGRSWSSSTIWGSPSRA